MNYVDAARGGHVCKTTLTFGDYPTVSCHDMLIYRDGGRKVLEDSLEGVFPDEETKRDYINLISEIGDKYFNPPEEKRRGTFRVILDNLITLVSRFG